MGNQGRNPGTGDYLNTENAQFVKDLKVGESFVCDQHSDCMGWEHIFDKLGMNCLVRKRVHDPIITIWKLPRSPSPFGDIIEEE